MKKKNLKKAIYLLSVFFALSMAWSCENDDEDDKKKDEGGIKEETSPIPDGWEKNDDLLLLYKKPYFLYRSDSGDSINIYFYSKSIECYFYQKNINDGYNYRYTKQLKEVYSIEKNNKKEFRGKYGSMPYSISYELTNDSTVLIHNLPGEETFSEGLKFEKTRSVYNSNNKTPLLGGWYNSQVVDSTVIAFENSRIKEYLFVKGTSTIQESWDYGGYTASLTKTYLKEEFLGMYGELKFEEFEEENCSYRIIGDKLIIYWESPRKTTTYTRIKD